MPPPNQLKTSQTVNKLNTNQKKIKAPLFSDLNKRKGLTVMQKKEKPNLGNPIFFCLSLSGFF
jgi:hypothetical protein